jgi:hypothetical protein
LRLTANMPMFIQTAFFNSKIGSVQELEAFFNEQSRAFHLPGGSIGTHMRYVRVESHRNKNCIATSNRIRHTVLTRGAQKGLDATSLAKITGVTTPAARHYIDMDYESRLMIDVLYLGSDFLANIFSSPLELVPEGDECVNDQSFNPVGGLRDKHSCSTCSTVMGRPLGCYGCNNFRPILEADHGQVLEFAELKLKANSNFLLSISERLSVEKIEKQIRQIKLTMNACEQVLEARRGIEQVPEPN